MLKQLHGLAPRTIRYSLPLVAIILVAAAVAISLNLALAQSANGVYDTDGDRLIEISNIEQLRAMVWDDDGDGRADQDERRDEYANGFPVSGNQLVCDRSCNGYELSRPLDFADPGSYASGAVNPIYRRGEGWGPNFNFNAIFDGNDHSITNLYMDSTLSSDLSRSGFFANTLQASVIRNIRLVDVEMNGHDNTGGLVGVNKGTITNSSVTGRVSGTGVHTGGLVASNDGTISLSYSTADVTGAGADSDAVGGLVGRNDARITESYATGSVRGDDNVGGLVGYNRGSGGSGGHISISYATGSVSGDTRVGGLAGASYIHHDLSRVSCANIWDGGTPAILNSVYATGSVSGHDSVGGLLGWGGYRFSCRNYLSSITAGYSVSAVSGNNNVGALVGHSLVERRGTFTRINASYWNSDVTSERGIGNVESHAGAEGKTTAELQEPTDRTGIYASWSSQNWDFGSGRQYPALKADMDGDGVATAAEFGGQGRTPGQVPPTPTMEPTGKYVDFSMGLGHICLLRDDGVVECSGDNSLGQATPPDGGRYVKLDGGDNHTCGLWEDGDVDCWGSVAGTFSKNNPPVPPTPTPTPTPGPTTPQPTVGPTAPAADSCVETLSANGSVIGEWASGCQSETQANDDSGGYPYARYYSFTLAEDSEVTVTLERRSGDADTYLYLRDGDARSGGFLYENDDDGGTTRSEIVATLEAGSYTIEATTYEAGQTGGFTLTISGL